MKQLLCFALLALMILSARAGEVKLTFDKGGVVINVSSGGMYTLPAPDLILETSDKIENPTFMAGEGTGKATYHCGAMMLITAKGENLVFEFSNVPANAHGWRFTLTLPTEQSFGKTYSLGGKSFKEFPRQQSNQFIENGVSANKFILVDSAKNGFSLNSETNWYGLQDNRLFNTATFAYMFVYDLPSHPGKKSFSIQISRASTN